MTRPAVQGHSTTWPPGHLGPEVPTGMPAENGVEERFHPLVET